MGGNHKRGFQRDWLPSPADFYGAQFPAMRVRGNSQWAMVQCCFHPDAKPSLSVNVTEHQGGFKCHACGAKGSDVVAFTMLRDGVDFKTAAQSLGAWGMRE